jgi:hypothetical protein
MSVKVRTVETLTLCVCVRVRACACVRVCVWGGEEEEGFQRSPWKSCTFVEEHHEVFSVISFKFLHTFAFKIFFTINILRHLCTKRCETNLPILLYTNLPY